MPQEGIVCGNSIFCGISKRSAQEFINHFTDNGFGLVMQMYVRVVSEFNNDDYDHDDDDDEMLSQRTQVTYGRFKQQVPWLFFELN